MCATSKVAFFRLSKHFDVLPNKDTYNVDNPKDCPAKDKPKDTANKSPNFAIRSTFYDTVDSPHDINNRQCEDDFQPPRAIVKPFNKTLHTHSFYMILTL